MGSTSIEVGCVGGGKGFTWLCFLVGCCGPLGETLAYGQERGSLAGEKAAEALKEAAQAQAQQYNLHWGPVDFQIGAAVRFGFTDNVFYTPTNRTDDFVISPEVRLGAFMQVSELNTIGATVGVGYEYYVKNTVLNPDAPLINPDTDLTFNLFVGNAHFTFREKFTYQQTLFINTTPGGQDLLFNFNNIGIFTRWDNRIGFDVDWDLDKVIITAGYNHENFASSTASFEYLNRASEWFTASAAYLPSDWVRIGVEGQGSYHDYASQATLDDNWRGRGGPFVQIETPAKITIRGGGGYDAAWYDTAGANSDFATYYGYGRISQETRLFTHSISGGRENLLGDNANNLEDNFLRYSINFPALLENMQIAAEGAVHWDKEYGGAYLENFTYYVAGLTVGYQLAKYWRTQAGYEYIIKNSDLPLKEYSRNRVTVSIAFTF